MATAVQTPEKTDADAATAERTPFQLADIYRLRLVNQPAVSPDGKRIAFVIYGSRQEKNERTTSLWLAPSDGSAPARQLTRSGNDSAPAWSPDGRSLAFLSTRPDEPEMAPEKPPAEPRQQLWLLDLDGGGEPRQLTARPEGVISFDWSPDGTRIVFAARDPSEAQERYLKSIRGELDGAGGEHGPLIIKRGQHKWDGVGYLDEVRSHLFVLDVESREVRRLTDGPCDEIGPPWNRGGPRWSPRGDWIVFVSNRTGDADNNQRVDLWLVSPDGDAVRRLTFGDVNAGEPRWAPDGASIAFIASQTPDALAWNTSELCWIGIDHAEPVADPPRAETAPRAGRRPPRAPPPARYPSRHRRRGPRRAGQPPADRPPDRARTETPPIRSQDRRRRPRPPPAACAPPAPREPSWTPRRRARQARPRPPPHPRRRHTPRRPTAQTPPPSAPPAQRTPARPTANPRTQQHPRRTPTS